MGEHSIGHTHFWSSRVIFRFIGIQKKTFTLLEVVGYLIFDNISLFIFFTSAPIIKRRLSFDGNSFYFAHIGTTLTLKRAVRIAYPGYIFKSSEFSFSI